MTFEQFLRETAVRGGLVNTLFEAHLFAMVGTLEKIAGALASECVPYELIGGGAVMVQVNRVEPAAVRMTRDIDIMINHSDLERLKVVAAKHGFTFRHAMGVDMLLPPGEVKALNAIHLIFSGQKTKASQAVPNPPLRPEYLTINGVQVSVIPVADLVQMKLSNNRDKDRVHVRDMDSVGLITPDVEASLPVALRNRLAEIRTSE